MYSISNRTTFVCDVIRIIKFCEYTRTNFLEAYLIKIDKQSCEALLEVIDDPSDINQSWTYLCVDEKALEYIEDETSGPLEKGDEEMKDAHVSL